jgi:hypothetical protein
VQACKKDLKVPKIASMSSDEGTMQYPFARFSIQDKQKKMKSAADEEDDDDKDDDEDEDAE